jgi:hypothetical protein
MFINSFDQLLEVQTHEIGCNSIKLGSPTVLLQQDTSTPAKVQNQKGELWLNTFVVFHIATKVLSFAQLSPTFVSCLLLSFLL